MAKPESAGDETFELTAWMERARKKPSSESEALTPETVDPPIFSEARPARPKTRPTPPPVVEQPSPTLESAPEAPETTPAVTAQESPTPAADTDAFIEPAPVIEDLPVVSHESETADPPELVESLTPITDAEVPLDDSTNDTSEDIVLFSAGPVAEASTPADEQPESPVVAPIADSEVEFDLGTIRVNANGNGHVGDGGTHDNGHITVEPAEIVVRQNGRSDQKPAEVDTDAAQNRSTEARAKVVSDDNDTDRGLDIRIEIHLNSSRAMKVKRWEDKEDPFEGFNSPPGRF